MNKRSRFYQIFFPRLNIYRDFTYKRTVVSSIDNRDIN